MADSITIRTDSETEHALLEIETFRALARHVPEAITRLHPVLDLIELVDLEPGIRILAQTIRPITVGDCVELAGLATVIATVAASTLNTRRSWECSGSALSHRRSAHRFGPRTSGCTDARTHRANPSREPVVRTRKPSNLDQVGPGFEGRGHRLWGGAGPYGRFVGMSAGTVLTARRYLDLARLAASLCPGH